MLESDMYNPIKEYLSGLGYTVKAEVNYVDVVAKKEDSIIIVEMKKKLTLKHLYQGCDRQRMFDNVYLAIIDPGYQKIKSRKFKEIIHILNRLRLGLMVVNVERNIVEVVLGPKPYQFKRNIKKQTSLINEFNQRYKSSNIGGINKQKIMTAYREAAIEIGRLLLNGPLTTGEIRRLTKNSKATKILYNNYYKWFIRIDRGLYKLSDLGMKEINKYI